jgi:hypothetical protein
MEGPSHKVTMAALGLINGCVGPKELRRPQVEAAPRAAFPVLPGGISLGLSPRSAACLCDPRSGGLTGVVGREPRMRGEGRDPSGHCLACSNVQLALDTRHRSHPACSSSHTFLRLSCSCRLSGKEARDALRATLKAQKEKESAQPGAEKELGAVAAAAAASDDAGGDDAAAVFSNYQPKHVKARFLWGFETQLRGSLYVPSPSGPLTTRSQEGKPHPDAVVETATLAACVGVNTVSAGARGRALCA